MRICLRDLFGGFVRGIRFGICLVIDWGIYLGICLEGCLGMCVGIRLGICLMDLFEDLSGVCLGHLIGDCLFLSNPSCIQTPLADTA